MIERIARTGRVQSWLDNPQSRLPVSCTVFNVMDSYEGPDGIEEAITFAGHALRYGAGCAIHLSNLRPRGHDNGKGLISSGPVSFAKIFSTLNEVLRRGGTYRSGAITIHLDLNHADIDEFLTASRRDLPWVKRCVDVTEEWWNETSELTKQLIYKGIQAGDIWLCKVKYDKHGERIFFNVCLEIALRSRGTCLLEHISLGACRVEDLSSAFEEGMAELCDLHQRTGVSKSGHYLPPEEDRQVGLGVLGLANFLALNKVSYEEFGEALEQVNSGPFPLANTPATVLAEELRKAIYKAADIARLHRMERAFTIAPTATCSYRYQDLEGNTCTPEIAPPIAREVDRDSGTFGVQSYSYGDDIEIAAEVGYETFRKVADGLVQMFTDTGLFHGYSLNSWSDCCTYDENFIRDWLESVQTSLYYALQVQPDTLRKDDAAAIMDEDYKDIFGFEEWAQDDNNYCSSCAE